MTITTVLWDLGGVLVRTEDPHQRQQLAVRLGISRHELERLVFNGESGDRAQRGEIDIQEHWENIRRLFGLDEAALREFQSLFWGGDRVDYQLVDFIRSLRGNYKSGLLSNAFSDLREVVSTVWKFADVFDEMVISSEVGLVKPDPAIYRLALERLRSEPQQAVFLDDMLANVDGAKAVGMHAIHFHNPAQARAELEQLLNGETR
jgi:epoxide hydrolase-like predicted phosphatase